MNGDPLDLLLKPLSQGDLAAVDRLVTDYEPYLRTLVRHSLPGPLRAKFDSLDVVQSVWVHVLHGLRRGGWDIPDRAHLLALLVTLTRRRLISLYRHHRPSVACEAPGGTDLEAVPAAHQPRPSEVVEAGELWERMLALCPPEYHELLRLRRQGLLLREIAARTGLHEGSVRRIFRQLARQLALGQGPCAGEDDGSS